MVHVTRCLKSNGFFFYSVLFFIEGKRRSILFQYEMGTTDTVNNTIDSLLNDWSKIVYLYHLVHDFAEQFKNGLYFSN